MSFPKRLCLVVHISTSLLLLLLQAHAHSGHDDPQEDSTHDGAGNLHDKGLIRVKVWCLLIFLISTFAGGVSPYFYRWNESFLLLGTQFAGGIFLGTAMMHFLSDSAETFGDLTSKSYPFAFLLALVGYLLTMLGDCVVSLVLARGGKVRSGTGGDVEEQGKRVGDGDGHGAAMDVHRALIKVSSLGDTLLLIAALCFHSVFEGIAVGVADTKYDAWRNLWTISLHKIFAAVAMGIALLKMLPSRPFLTTAAYSFAFAISSPIGVGIGIAIDATTQGAVADWIFCISMGIATGVFIYVAINHLINKGYKPQSPSYFDTPFFKFLAVLVGVGVMSVVMIWD